MSGINGFGFGFTDLVPLPKSTCGFSFRRVGRDERENKSCRESAIDLRRSCTSSGKPSWPSQRGKSTAEVCKKLGVAEQTYYRWRREYGGLKVDRAKKLKEVERENARHNQHALRGVEEASTSSFFLTCGTRTRYISTFSQFVEIRSSDVVVFLCTSRST